GNLGNRCRTRPHRCSLDMNRAGSAQSRTASELRAGQVQRVAQNPEQRRVRRHTDLALAAVYPERDVRHGRSQLLFGKAEYRTQKREKEEPDFQIAPAVRARGKRVPGRVLW